MRQKEPILLKRSTLFMRCTHTPEITIDDHRRLNMEFKDEYKTPELEIVLLDQGDPINESLLDGPITN